MTVRLYRESDLSLIDGSTTMPRVLSGETVSETLLLRNDGEQSISSLTVWRTDDDRLPGRPELTAAGQVITATSEPGGHELLSAPLAPGQSVPLSYRYSMAAEDQTVDTDSMTLGWSWV